MKTLDLPHTQHNLSVYRYQLQSWRIKAGIVSVHHSIINHSYFKISVFIKGLSVMWHQHCQVCRVSLTILEQIMRILTKDFLSVPFPGGTKYLVLSKPCFSIQRAPWVSRRSYRGLVRSWRPVWKSHRGTFSSYSRAAHRHTQPCQKHKSNHTKAKLETTHFISLSWKETLLY